MILHNIDIVLQILSLFCKYCTSNKYFITHVYLYMWIFMNIIIEHYIHTNGYGQPIPYVYTFLFAHLAHIFSLLILSRYSLHQTELCPFWKPCSWSTILSKFVRRFTMLWKSWWKILRLRGAALNVSLVYICIYIYISHH